MRRGCPLPSETLKLVVCIRMVGGARKGSQSQSRRVWEALWQLSSETAAGKKRVMVYQLHACCVKHTCAQFRQRASPTLRLCAKTKVEVVCRQWRTCLYMV